MADETATTLLISTPTGERLGRLTFDDKHRGELTLLAHGPQALQLQDACAEIGEKDTLPLRTTERTEIDDEMVYEIVRQDVPQGHESFKWAVRDYLEQKLAYHVEIE
ncbi:hypothetical protein ACFL59_15660 [Planctomycetota bacterium]